MKEIVIPVLIILGIVLAFCLIFGSGLGYLLSDDTAELANRTACGARQKELYRALDTYLSDHGHLPPGLVTLVEQGYVRMDHLCCPGVVLDPNMRLYKYFPAAFRHPNCVLISENPENHSAKRLRLWRVKPAYIETMGDGKIVINYINGKEGPNGDLLRQPAEPAASSH